MPYVEWSGRTHGQPGTEELGMELQDFFLAHQVDDAWAAIVIALRTDGYQLFALGEEAPADFAIVLALREILQAMTE